MRSIRHGLAMAAPAALLGFLVACGGGSSESTGFEKYATVAPVKVSGEISCTTATGNTARKIAADSLGTVYAVMTDTAGNAYVVTSRDGGRTYSAPLGIATGVGANQVAVHVGPAGVAYLAYILSTGEVMFRVTPDRGATWGTATSLGNSTYIGAGLSLATHNDSVYVAFGGSTGLVVARNAKRGSGAFTSTTVALAVGNLDLVCDSATGNLTVCSDTPGFHLRTSTDGGVTFGVEVNPDGLQYYSDWALGNGRIFVSGANLTSTEGSSDRFHIIPLDAPGTSSTVIGLPVITTNYSRTVAADALGNAYAASGLNGGGVRLDRLAAGASSFSTARTLSLTGTSPIVEALPKGQGAAVVYTEGAAVYVTVQAY